MKKWIVDWYEGEKIPYDNPPGSQFVFIGWDVKRHWTARVARVLVEFWLAHWQWTIGTLLALIALILTWRT